MTLIKYDKNRNKRIPSLFESFFNDEFGVFPDYLTKAHMNRGFPSVNTKETGEGYKIELAAPGMSKEDFEINLDGGILTVSSNKKFDKKEEDEGYTLREFSYSSFSRSFTMPDDINGDEISAKYENGVLNLEIPKMEIAKKSPKLIEVS